MDSSTCLQIHFFLNSTFVFHSLCGSSFTRHYKKVKGPPPHTPLFISGMNIHGAAEQMEKKTKQNRNLMDGGKIYLWSHGKNNNRISFSLRRKFKSLTITKKISSHNNNKRHYCLFCISSFLNTGIIYSTTPTSPLLPCEVKCVEVSEAGCWTPRSAAGVECCVRSCSHFGACSAHRSECLECAVLSNWWPLQGDKSRSDRCPSEAASCNRQT